MLHISKESLRTLPNSFKLGIGTGCFLAADYYLDSLNKKQLYFEIKALKDTNNFKHKKKLFELREEAQKKPIVLKLYNLPSTINYKKHSDEIKLLVEDLLNGKK